VGVYLVTYDLNKADKDYEDLIDAIKAYGSYCKLQRSVWFIDSNDSASQIRDDLKQHIDKNDDLFVGEMRKHWAGANKMKCVDWLKGENRNWAKA
jgi:CRISPR-associated endonuclease Cas2